MRVLLLTLLLLLPPLAQGHSITVDGEARVQASPDRFSLTLVIARRGNNILALNQQVQKRTQRLLGAIEQSGVDSSNLRATDIRLHALHRPMSEGTTEPSYELSRSIEVLLSDADDYARVIDMALQSGATGFRQASADLNDESQAYQQALLQALANARQKAEALADAAGMTLGLATAIEEASGGGAGPMMAMAERSRAGQYPTGKLDIGARVRVTYGLKAAASRPD